MINLHKDDLLSKKFKLGKICYWLYYFPKGLIEKCVQRDLISRIVDGHLRSQMEKAAMYLKPLSKDFSIPEMPVYFLSGNKFWYQTCFCIYSMQKHSNITLKPIIYDDYSLKEEQIGFIKSIFQNSEFHKSRDIEAHLDEHLPWGKFPYLRRRRLEYPNLRKITDIHAGSIGWKLILDSDMLFFKRPTLLIEWLCNADKPCYMVDVKTSYGYSRELMSSLAQSNIPEKLNVGICGIKSEEIDWDIFEYWCKTLISREGTNYYQEQALIAMCLAGRECYVFPSEDYIVMPTKNQVVNCTGVLQHYVDRAKPWYFRYGWKSVL